MQESSVLQGPGKMYRIGLSRDSPQVTLARGRGGREMEEGMAGASCAPGGILEGWPGGSAEGW